MSGHGKNASLLPFSFEYSLESLRISSNLTIWFIVEQRVPKDEGQIGIRVERVLVSVSFNA